jgi:antitoxin YefM
MSHVSFTAFRQHLARYFDEVANAREPLVVTRQGGKGNVVVMSEAEFAGWEATVHLLRSPKNAEHLLESVRQVRAGQVTEHELIDPDEPNPTA